MRNKNLLIWASDLSENTGEGILARVFLFEIQKLLKYETVKIKTLESHFNINQLNINKIKLKDIDKKTIYHKYFGPIYGAVYLLLFSRKYDVLYLNYLPFWNFIIFLILPSKTILGPITGGIYCRRVNNINLFVRKYFFPFFYSISKIIIYRKFKNIIFSTNILKKFTTKDKPTLTNFIEILFCKQLHNTNKNFDIIFYNRHHPTKFPENIKETVIRLSKYYRVCVIGDHFKNGNVTNFGWLERNKVLKLIQRSKLAINSAENFLSIFGIDCINNGVLVAYDKNIKFFLKNKNTNYLQVNFNNINVATKKINIFLSKAKVKKNLNWWSNITLKKKRIRDFLLSYLTK